MTLNYFVEARVKALEEAVKFSTQQLHFHNTAETPEIIKLDSKEIINVARNFECYIMNG